MEPSHNTRDSRRNVNTLFEDEAILDSPKNKAWKRTSSSKAIKIIDDPESEPNSQEKLIKPKGGNFTSVGYNPFVQEDKKQALSRTFMQMEYRKLYRSSSGSYKDNPRGSLWGITYFLVLGAYITYQFYFMDQDDTWKDLEIWKEVLLELLLTVVLFYASARMQTFANSLTLFWVYILVTGFFLLVQETFRYLFFLIILCLICTWTGHLIYYYIGPMILRESRYCFGWRRVKSRIVQDEESQDNYNSNGSDVREVVFEYRPLTKVLTCSAPNTFMYRGEWKDGRPSGWGEWRDDSFYGESLSGYWENGIPRGPFDSVERGTGNFFTSVAVGYCSMRGADWKCQPFAELTRTLTFGMAYEECPVSGAYYMNFPIHHEIREFRYIPEEHSLEGMKKILPCMISSGGQNLLSQVLVTATPNGLDIRGFEPVSSDSHTLTQIEIQNLDEDEEPQLSISGWELSTKPEILIFVHGYNIPLDWAMKKLGQLVASGKFPPNIKPFVFSWPTGKIFYYFQSVKVATSDAAMQCFEQFLNSIIAAGVQNVHIMTHSMGIKLFMKALSVPSILNLFANSSHHDVSTQDKLHLVTATFTNADYPVKQFRDKEYETLRNICNNISFYVDKYDDALKYASIFTRTMLIGSLSTPFYDSTSATKLLDLDIIDTSGLQDNMHSVRHSAFNVNRMMVEDLREIIVARKRAKERASRLVNKKGNLFSFMTTPAAVNGNIV